MVIQHVKYQYVSSTGNTMQFKLAIQCGNTFTTSCHTIFILKNMDKELKFDKDMQTDYAINAGLFSSGFINLNQDFPNYGFGYFDTRYKFWDSTKLTKNCKLKTMNKDGYLYIKNDDLSEFEIVIIKNARNDIYYLYDSFINGKLNFIDDSYNKNSLYLKNAYKK